MDICIYCKITKASPGMMNNEFKIVVISGEGEQGVGPEKGIQVSFCCIFNVLYFMN